MTLRLLQSISVVVTGTIASETVQKLANQKVEDTAITCQLTKTANCIATPMRKHIQQFFYLFTGDTSQVSVFS